MKFGDWLLSLFNRMRRVAARTIEPPFVNGMPRCANEPEADRIVTPNEPAQWIHNYSFGIAPSIAEQWRRQHEAQKSCCRCVGTPWWQGPIKCESRRC